MFLNLFFVQSGSSRQYVQWGFVVQTAVVALLLSVAW
jgi:hypothetical protein